MTHLLDLGLALVFAIIAVSVGTFLWLRVNDDLRRSVGRGRRFVRPPLGLDSDHSASNLDAHLRWKLTARLPGPEPPAPSSTHYEITAASLNSEPRRSIRR